MTTLNLQADAEFQGAEGGDALDKLASNLLLLGIRGRIQRVDISRKGELTVRVTTDGQQRWLQIDPQLCGFPVQLNDLGLVTELKASRDSKLPLSRLLSAEGSGAGLTVLSYIPHRRLVLLDGRDCETRVLKGYRGRTGSEKTSNKGERLAEKYTLATQGDIPNRFFTPGKVHYNPTHHYMSMPFFDGMQFKVADEHVEDFSVLGQGISKLQGIDDRNVGLSSFTRRAELDVIDERARRMQLLGFFLPDGWKTLRQRLEVLCSEIPEAPLVPCHRDLHDGQLIRSLRGLGLFDFDLFCRAEPELDPGNFLAHLCLRQLQIPHRISDRSVQVCGRKLLDGLNAYERAAFWSRLRFYQASTFCRLQLVYALRPRWVSITSALGRLGHRCLDDLQHEAE
ncbi:MAG TPA: phosphotransferase [Xanthomonadales bacterium]|nr:phosphotransferase [Xanthomonadales bacterium]